MTENKTTECKATENGETLKAAGTPKDRDSAILVGSADETMELSELQVRAISGGAGAPPLEIKK
jgi:hypothetical protein